MRTIVSTAAAVLLYYRPAAHSRCRATAGRTLASRRPAPRSYHQSESQARHHDSDFMAGTPSPPFRGLNNCPHVHW